MVCHICSDPASAQCCQCLRYICTAHITPTTFGYTRKPFCTSCTTEAEERRLREKQFKEDALRELERAERCGWCSVTHPGTIECGSCKRAFCDAHGQRLLWTTGSYEKHYWFRCRDHLIRKGVLGYKVLDMSWVTMTIMLLSIFTIIGPFVLWPFIPTGEPKEKPDRVETLDY